MFKLPSLLVPALLLWNLSAGDAGLPAAAESVNRNLWSRFMSPDSVLYDYAGPAGESCCRLPRSAADTSRTASAGGRPSRTAASSPACT